MPGPLSVGLIFGGPSAEHNVSLVSAKCILKAFDRRSIKPFLLGVSREGRWFLVTEEQLLKTEFDQPIAIGEEGDEVFLLPQDHRCEIRAVKSFELKGSIDVAFPIAHGPFGEDGSLQGYLKILQIPFVGCDVAASALCMDKEFAKRIMQSVGIPQAEFMVFRKSQSAEIIQAEIQKHFKFPIYVKPANMGSSVGVHKVSDPKSIFAALEDAFKYDEKILVEENIDGTEVEVAVFGRDIKAEASQPGAFVVHAEFYTYEAKYLKSDGATFQVPATGDSALNQKIREFALKVYRALDCQGMARVDMFLTKSQDILINEVNTLPGFTPISMYPMLWEKSGVAFPQLINQLVEEAIKRN